MKIIPFQELVKQYPKPISAKSARSTLLGYYCVGGAFCLAHGYDEENFPGPPALAEIMVHVFGVKLVRDKDFVIRQAIVITHLNDDLSFNTAWDALKAVYDAYAYGQP